MKGSDLLDKMELIDPGYIEAAEDFSPERKSSMLPKILAAACIVLAVAGAGILWKKPAGPGPAGQDDPVWEGSEKVYDGSRWGSKADAAFRLGDPISIPKMEFSGYGFEGLKASDPSKIHEENPWTESFEGYLPVYASRKYDLSGSGYPIGLSELEMREYMGWLCQSLELKTVCIGEERELSPLQKYYASFYKKGVAVPSKYLAKVLKGLTAYTDKGHMEVYANGETRIDILGRYVLDGSLSSGDISLKELEDAVIDIAKECSSRMGFEDPVIDVYYQKRWDKRIEEMADVPLCRVWEGAGDQRARILDYNLYSLAFYYWDDALTITIDNCFLTAEKLGDYPVIDSLAAVERLKAGFYASSYPEPFRGEEYIGKIELVYRHGPLEKLIMPYYRIYLLIDPVNETEEEERKNGIGHYAAYYVPAIADEYITDMPTYDGRFN